MGSPGLDLELDAAGLERNIRTHEQRNRAAGLGAVTDTAREVEHWLEDATRAAAGGKLWQAWKSKVYADDLASIVYIKGGERTRKGLNFAGGSGRIKARAGRYTAIPLPAAGPVGRARNLTPAMWEQRTGLTLRPVFRRGRNPVLVADRAALSGPRQRATRSRIKRQGPGYGATVPIFVLLPARAFMGSFSIDATAQRGRGRLAINFQRRLGRLG